MKVLLVNNTDLEGGASRAAYRLNLGLCQEQVSASMLVQTKFSDNPSIVGTKSSSGIGKVLSGSRLILDKLPMKWLGNQTQPTFSIQWVPDNVNAQIRKISPDIINLHWINGGFIQIESIAKLNKPIVWTLHDMWAFTGGCHYNENCNRYQKTCGSCPQLGSKKNIDLSKWVWRRKAKAWRDINLTLVSPSRWLADCARASSLFENYRVEVIPNGIDTTIYKPYNKLFAREVLGLPQDKPLILFGALSATSDKRKGFHLLQSALKQLKELGNLNNPELAIFGASQPPNLPELSFRAHYLGTFQDDVSLALIYSAADVFVLPSMQDNLPNTVLEALACGLPCVAFNIGGVPDMVEHQKNGYLVSPFNTTEFAFGISWILENMNRYSILSKYSRTKIKQEFALNIQAKRYCSLLTEICGK